jgi:hypothetical protein
MGRNDWLVPVMWWVTCVAIAFAVFFYMNGQPIGQ